MIISLYHYFGLCNSYYSSLKECCDHAIINDVANVTFFSEKRRGCRIKKYETQLRAGVDKVRKMS
jgi:hypothetical protein